MECVKLLRTLLKSMSFSDTIIECILKLPNDCEVEVISDEYPALLVSRQCACLLFYRDSVNFVRDKKLIEWIVEQFLKGQPINACDCDPDSLAEIAIIGVEYNVNYKKALVIHRLLK